MSPFKNTSILFSAVMLLLALASGCNNGGEGKPNFQSGYFDLSHFIKQQVSLLGKSPKTVEKIAFLNGKTEHHEITLGDSTKWATELAPFLEADINKPAYIKRYSVDSIRENDSLFIVDYKALDDKLRSRELKLYYKGATALSPFKIEARLKSDRIFSHSQQFISYTTYGEYEVMGRQDVVFSKPDTFAIHARFMPF